jgi:hypothetical protein
MNLFVDEIMEEYKTNTHFKVEFVNHNINKIGGLKWLNVEFEFISATIFGKLQYYICTCVSFDKIDLDVTDDDGDDVSLRQLITSPRSDGIPTKEEVVAKILEMIRILKTVRFDKLTGKFLKEDDKPFTVACLSSAEDCPICYEKTETMTDCGHYLCIPCWLELNKSACPLCRKEEIKCKTR